MHCPAVVLTADDPVSPFQQQGVSPQGLSNGRLSFSRDRGDIPGPSVTPGSMAEASAQGKARVPAGDGFCQDAEFSWLLLKR